MKSKVKFYINIVSLLLLLALSNYLLASSHREAPLISSDPLADNTDLYAFRSPDNPNMITLIATYVPFQLPHGGPNYYNFGKNIRYEIHVDNDASKPGDEITYRFTFNIVNEDPTTFFNIRLGKQNQKTTYTLERSIDGGMSFQVIVQNGVVPPNNIGDRSITGGAGLGTTYNTLFQNAITTATTGERVFAGPSDDPFFVDLGGIFDLGDAPRQSGKAVDGLACYNISALAIQVPISTLLKKGAPATPTNILDSDYVIGVWASASRQAVTTLSKTSEPTSSGSWVQVSRLGMPLTNEAVIPIGDKDFWNSLSPYDEITETTLDKYFFNPELALYMDDSLFGGAVPAFAKLRIQQKSLGSFDFTNGADGLFGLKGNPALAGTALDDAVFGTLLLPGPGMPRSVDLWPAFHTGVPNVIPYQLATGKNGNPLAAGKPFVNNFLPNGGDMLRLNMAVPPTPRNDPSFSSLGLIQAAAIGLTVAPFNTNKNLEFIPNMDGFPNGRRLEDDVTRIELQAVAGVVLAAVGLWYDDYDPATSASPVTPQLLNVLTYTTGVESNDKPFTSAFPYVAMPSNGTGSCSGTIVPDVTNIVNPDFSLFVSSNTQNKVGLFGFNASGTSYTSTFDVSNTDADGIYYDQKTDVLYQLNRSANVIQAYTKVRENIEKSEMPVLSFTSTSDFTNGREIAVQGDKIVVVQDADASNGNADKFIVYKIGPTSITLDKTYTINFPLWGIHIDGNTLFAVEDVSARVVRFDGFFDLPAGMITPNQIVTIESMTRTHGITYDKQGDIMILTDVASAASATDGAFTVIKNYTTKAADNMISLSEQIIVEGPLSLLGNPVDIAYDRPTNMVYIAERAKDGGRVLGFVMPTTSGDFAPKYNAPFAGASAVFLADFRAKVVTQPDIVVKNPNFKSDFVVSTRLTGSNEVPAVTTNALGVATITFNDTYTKATINVTASNLSSAFTGMHIHTGAADQNGPVKINLSGSYKEGRATAIFDVTKADVSALVSGQYYLNIHSTQFPGGEIRGQLGLEASESFMTSLNASLEVPAVKSDGKGLASIIYTSNTNTMEINILASQLSGPITGLHLHRGKVGENGPVVQSLTSFIVGNTIKVKLKADDYISDLRRGDIYVNIHTEAYPGGEIRGQLKSIQGLYFDSWMTGKQEVPSITHDAIGLTAGFINTTLDTLHSISLVDNPSGAITAAHYHKGSLGVSGGVVIPLVGIAGQSIVGQNIPVNATLLNDFLAGNLYINAHTSKYPGGELRGQVYRIARDGYAFDICQSQEVGPVVNAGTASGSALVAVNRDFDELHLMVVANSLSSAFQGAHIHKGAIGQNGPVVYNFTDKWTNNGAFFYATTGFTDSLIQTIQTAQGYINVHTTNNPNGELRGQIVKLSNCPLPSATVDIGNTSIEINVFPNPTIQWITIQIDGEESLFNNSQIDISDISGRRIMSKNISGPTTEINTSTWSPGMYFVRIANSNFNKTMKVNKL